MTTAADPERAGIDGHAVRVVDIAAGASVIRLCTVDDLETLIDRGAVLRGDVEPPYWAYLWSGARILADYVARWVDVRKRRVLEIGCGLGLPAVTAALAGGAVTAVDEQATALAFVRASAAANRTSCTTVTGDFITFASERRFDVVLAAEVAYDRARFAELAAVFDRQLGQDGLGLLADGYRTDTRAVYAAFRDAGFTTHSVDVAVVEEGRRKPIRLSIVRRGAGPWVSARDSRRPPA